MQLHKALVILHKITAFLYCLHTKTTILVYGARFQVMVCCRFFSVTFSLHILCQIKADYLSYIQWCELKQFLKDLKVEKCQK